MGEKRSWRDKLLGRKHKESHHQGQNSTTPVESSRQPSLKSLGATQDASATNTSFPESTSTDNRPADNQPTLNGIENDPPSDPTNRLVPTQTGNGDNSTAQQSAAQGSATTESPAPEPDNSTTSQQPGSLWDEAYDALKASHGDLIKAYEDLLSRVLQKHGCQAPESTPGAEPPDDSDHVDNLIPQHDAAARRQMMDDITALGLKHAEDKKISTTILGHEITIEAAIANTASIVSWSEDYIKDAVKDLPYASIVVVGVSLVLPLLKNPVAAEEARDTGFIYVTSQMRYYAAMEPFLMLGDAKLDLEMQDQATADLTRDLASRLSQLYESIIEFQVRCVIHLYRSRTKNFFRGTINYDNWKSRLASIKEAEKELEGKFAASQSALNLDALNKTRYEAAESRKQLTDMLNQMMQALNDQLGVTSRMDRRMESEEDRNCIKSLHANDPRDNKTRIESKKGGLLEGLSRWIFDNHSFQQWRNQPAQSLLWIRGDPGKGKTMIICTIIDALIKSPSAYKSNVCYFFCEATLNQANNACAVVRGLIYMLLKQQPELMTHLRELHDGIESRFEGENAWYALAKLLKQLTTDPKLNDTYMLIDGLDECNTNLTNLLDLIVDISTIDNSRIKWIVSSRNEEPMIEKLGRETSSDVQLSLELNAESVSVAVNAYIDYKLDILQPLKGYSEHERFVIHTHLREKSNATFLWVALVCQRLTELNEKQALREIKKGIFPPGLNDLYNQMLQKIEEARTAETIDICKKTLAIVCTVYRPITLWALPSMLGLHEEFMAGDGDGYDTDALRVELRWCGSFLSIKEDIITIVHQSAADFLLQSAVDRIFPEGIKQAHYILFSQSLRALNRVLRKDIYGLVHPGCLIDDISYPGLSPLAMVAYPAVYWVDHLDDSGAMSDAASAEDRAQGERLIYQFMTTKYIYWLEALSLTRALSSGIRAMAKLKELVSRSQFPQLTSTLRDADQFLRYFQVAIEQAPLQVYASALLFSPLSSITRKNFEHHHPSWVSLQPSPRKDWDACILTLEGHGEHIGRVQFLPDGNCVSSLCLNRDIRTWDITRGICKEIFPRSSGCRGRLRAFCSSMAAFSVARGRIHVWDTATHTCIKVLEGGASTRLPSLVFSPNERRIAEWLHSPGNTTVRIWDITGGNTRPIQALAGFTAEITSSVFSSDGQKLAVGSKDGIIRVWDIIANACTQTIEGHADSYPVLAFSPDDRRIASSLRDECGGLRIWDIDTGICTHTFNNSRTFEGIAFSPNNKSLACGCSDGTIQVWDMATSACVQFLQGHTERVTSLAFSSDGGRIVSGSADGTVRIWQVQPDATAAVSRTLEEHKAPIGFLTLSQDNQRIATTSNGIVQIWDATTGASLQRLEDSADVIRIVEFSPDGQKVVSSFAESDGLIRIWDAGTGNCIQKLQGHRVQTTSAVVSPDGQQAAPASWFGPSHIVNTINSSSSSPLLSFFSSSSDDDDDDDDDDDYDVDKDYFSYWLDPHPNMITAATFSPDGRKLVSGSVHDLRMWDATTGACLQTLRRHPRPTWQVSFSPDGSKLASSASCDVRVWDLATSTSYGVIYCLDQVKIVAFSPDSLKLALVTYSGVQVWDAVTADELLIKQRMFKTEAVAFSLDSRKLVASCPSGTYIWDVDTVANTDVIKTTSATGGAPSGWVIRADYPYRADSPPSRPRIRGYSLPVSLAVLDMDAHEDQSCVEVAIEDGRSLSDCVITVDSSWVLVDGRETLWLPGEYRTHKNTFAISGSTLMLGCASGQVFIVRFR